MSKRRVLHSWKEISTYTGRGIRTVQRYESKLAFPIRRPAGKSRSSVLAFSEEIDAWFSRAPLRKHTGSIEQAKLREGTLLTCHAIAKRAAHGRIMATATWKASVQQARRVEGLMQKLEKYRKPKTA